MSWLGGWAGVTTDLVAVGKRSGGRRRGQAANQARSGGSGTKRDIGGAGLMSMAERST